MKRTTLSVSVLFLVLVGVTVPGCDKGPDPRTQMGGDFLAVQKAIEKAEQTQDTEALARYMDSGFISLGEDARKALVRIGRPAVPALIKELRHRRPVRALGRMNAVKALGEIGDLRAAEALEEALEDEHKDIREAARESLNKIGVLRGNRLPDPEAPPIVEVGPGLPGALPGD